jgi:hypothetical protein
MTDDTVIDDNYFAKYDSLRNPKMQGGTQATIPDSPPPASDDYYAQYDHLRRDTTPKKNTKGGLAIQFPTGVNEGIANTLGAPVDLATKAINSGVAQTAAAPWLKPIVSGARAAASAAGYELPQMPEIKNPVGGSESIKSAMGLIGADPRNVPANTGAERIVRGAGEGVAGMVAPEAALGTLGRFGGLTPEIAAWGERLLGRSAGLGDVAKSATIGAAGGGTGEAAAEIAPEQYKPVMRAAGNVVGGGPAAMATNPRAAIELAREGLGPFTAAGQEAAASRPR